MGIRQKRGITPLIATVLLIGFTVALAAVIMTWGFDFITGQIDIVDRKAEISLKCASDLGFKVGVDCTTDKITVDNTGKIDIVALQLRKHEGNDIIPVDVPQVLVVGQKKGLSELGSLQGLTNIKVDVVATIKISSGKDIKCTEAVREVLVTCP